MAEEINVKPVTLTQPQIDEYTRLFAEEGLEPSQQLADTVSRTLQIDYPDLFSYQGLRDGTAGWFNTQNKPVSMPDGSMRSLSEMAPNERKLSNSQILKLFAVDEEGRPPEDGTFTKGFLRQAFPEFGGAASAIAAGKAGFALQQPIPPAGPVAVALKVAIPTVSSIAGFFGGYEAGELAADTVLGKERLVLPEHMADYKSGKTGATVLPWMFFPFLIGKDVSLGGGALLNNIGVLTSKGPLTALEIAQPGVAQTLKTGRGPRMARFAQGVENMLNSTRSAAYGAPKTTLALEAAAGYGAIRGRYEAERFSPGNEALGVAAEIGGSLTPSLFGAFLAQKLPAAKKAIGEYYDRYKSEGFSGIRSKANDAQLNLALNEIRDQLEIEGYTKKDVDNLIASLRDSSVDEFMVNEAGEKIRLTSGQKSTDPVLLAMQASMERTNKGLGRQRAESNREAINALRGVILTMSATGDREMIKQAAALQKELFDTGLAEELAIVADQVLQAAERVGATKGNRDLSSNLQLVTGNLLEEARSRESQLWSAIPELQISEFKNADGQVIPLPNFITNWQRILPSTPEAAAEYLPKLRNLQRFVTRKAEELGVAELAESVVEALPEAKVLDRRRAKITGLKAGPSSPTYDDRLASFKDFIADLPIEEQIKRLREATTEFRNPRFVDRKGGKLYADVLDAEADLLAAGQLRTQQIQQNAAEAISDQSEVGFLTVTEIQDMRTTALNIGRTALANNDLQTARIAHAFAADLLLDLESFPEGASAAYDSARAYSRSLNDVFTRAFAGDILSLDKKGGSRINPELLHNRLFTGGDDATYLRVEQMSKAAQFAVNEGLTGAVGAQASIYGGLEGLLRNARRATMDPDTGEIDPERLRKWVSTNSGTPEEPKLLDFFPTVKEDLISVEDANKLLKSTVLNSKKAVQDLRGQVTFMDLLPDTPGAVENPALVIARVMSKSSKAPMKSLNNLAKMIDVAPDDMKDLARQGLRSGILEWSMTHSGGSAGNFSPRAAYEGLFEKIPGAVSDTSIMEWALKNGVISESQEKKVRKVLTTMIKMEASAARNVDFDQFLADTGPMVDFYLRIAGSGMGERAASMAGSGNTLIAQGAGSRALRRVYGRIFKEIPASLKGNAVAALFEDPQLLADMLEKPRNDKQALNLAKRLANKFKELGFTGVATQALLSGGRRAAPFTGSSAAEDREDYVVPEIDNEPTVGPVSSAAPTVMPAPQPVPAQRVAPPTSTLASAAPVAPPPAAPAPSGPVNRQQYAALFPNDIASGMIRQQGTALMADGGAVKHFAAGGRADGPGSESEGHSSHGFGNSNSDLGDQDRSMTIEDRYRDNAERLRRMGVNTTPYVSSDQNQPMTISQRYLDNAARITPTVVTTPGEQVQAIQNNLSRADILSNIRNLSATSLANKTAPDVVSDFQNRLASGQFDKVPTNPAQARAEALRANNPTVASFAQPAPVAGPFGITTSTLNAVTTQPVGIDTLAPSGNPLSVQVGPGTFTPSYDPVTKSVMGTYQMRFARGGAVHGGIASMVRRSR